jgi:hypothetical protein
MYKKILESRQMGKQTFNQTKKILGILLCVFFVAVLTAPAISADAPHHNNNGLQLFNTEQSAKLHCPTDTVVWLNLPTGIYHYKGQHWYGEHQERRLCLSERSRSGRRQSYTGNVKIRNLS